MFDAPTDSVEHGIAIGIIGPNILMAQILDTIRAFPSFNPVSRVYNHENEAVEIAEELMQKVEVLLFSDPLSYRMVKNKIHFSIPTHYVPLTGTGLYRALFHIEKKHGLLKLSVDSVSKQVVEKIYKELGIREENMMFFDERTGTSIEDLVTFHREQFITTRSSAALTGVRSVSEALTQEGIPNELVVPTTQDISVSLERALLSTETRRSKESQIVVGLINVDDFSRLAIKKSSEHEVQRLRLDIHRLVLGYVESLDGHLTHLGGDEYLFITTRGIFERETGGYKSLPLARDAERYYNLSLSIGVGFGRSANEAGTHARLALHRSRNAGGNICFIVREDRSIIGPLEMTQPIEYDLSLIDIKLIKQVEDAGLTSVYLSKLLAYVSRCGKTEYFALDLASVLGVTVRSAHRFLLSLLDAGLIEIVGEEKGISKGRRKQIYRFTFLRRLIR